MNLHLNCNYMLREVFELGAPLPAFDAATSQRPSKTERVSKRSKYISLLKQEKISECSKSVGL